jgi:glycosyltransferase involved in cell wall biosynthesis
LASAWLGSAVLPTDGPRCLAAGVVAHNEERHLRSAVQSLLDQELPEGVSWGEIWVVASGCTDGTVGVARALAEEDARVRLVVEPDRGGKARALGEVFRRASGDALVLLNSDAHAEPGAVEELVRAVAGKPAPFAVMARPVVPKVESGRWASTMRWMWDLHHEMHSEFLATGEWGHLSDELLMLSLASSPEIPEGIINDGSYLAVWLSQHRGGRWYAPDARVTIQVPTTVRDHLLQRRRIHVGNGQVASVLGTAPASVPRQFLDQPEQTFRILRKMVAREGGLGDFASVATWEVVAHALALWDRLPPRKDHIRWQRIHPTSGAVSKDSREVAAPRPGAPMPPSLEVRVDSMLLIAKSFGTGVPLPQLRELLPSSGPESVEDLRLWLEERPALARVEGDWAFSATAPVRQAPERAQRALAYQSRAEVLWVGPLSFARSLVRCAGISGSVAFGEPRPGDDLDLFVVTRSGALWWFLARAYLALYLARTRNPDLKEPTPCLNYVMEDRRASSEFARRGDLLFAREALMVQPIQGDDYYRGLVASAPWMKSELPRLFETRSCAPGKTEVSRAPPLVQLLNLVAYPLVATYLQLAGLARNHHLRRRDAAWEGFRTVTSRSCLAFASRRFDQLRERYSASAPSSLGPEGRVTPSAPPFGR